MSSQSDTAIARRLCEQKYIRVCEYDCWMRSRSGETLVSMKRDYPNELRPGKFYYESTLYRWCQRVDQAIADARMVTAPVERPRRRNPFRITLASGHDCHDADDPTPQSKVSTESSSWNVPRLQAEGAVDRYSRKRA